MKKLIIRLLIFFTALLLAACETDMSLLEEQSFFSIGEDVMKYVTDGSFIQEAVNAESSGETCYNSSNEAVAIVDELTGEVEILATGTAFITAVNTGDEKYQPAVAVYELTVVDTKFITTWSTNDTGVITIPVYSSYEYDYIIDWGDGETIPGSSRTVTHQYDTPGTYTISISGTFPGIYFGMGGNEGEILSIENWGIIEWRCMNSAFYFCDNLVCNALDAPDLSNVTDMSNMFAYAASFNSDLSRWDVSNVTNMSYMFYTASSFSSDLSAWDVSNVTDMSYMFADAASFNSDLSSWDVSNVSIMSSLFSNAVFFNSDLSSWDVSSATNMRAMFSYAMSFDSNINNWDVSNVTDMSFMFRYAAAFNSNLNDWDVSGVTDMSYMFAEAATFDSSLSAWNVSNVTDMGNMFYNASGFNHHNLSAWEVSNVISTPPADFNTGWGSGNTEPNW